MAGARQILQVEIPICHLEHCPRIGKDMPRLDVRKDDRHARRSLSSRMHHALEIYSGMLESLQRDLAETVCTHPRNKSYPCAHHRNIVRKNRGRTAEG